MRRQGSSRPDIMARSYRYPSSLRKQHLRSAQTTSPLYSRNIRVTASQRDNTFYKIDFSDSRVGDSI
jgi:hypothetical protein